MQTPCDVGKTFTTGFPLPDWIEYIPDNATLQKLFHGLTYPEDESFDMYKSEILAGMLQL